MIVPTVDASRRNTARVAGTAYLLTFAVVVSASFGIFTRLSVPADAAATARDILAHEAPRTRTLMRATPGPALTSHAVASSPA